MNVLIADKFEASGVAGLKAIGCEVVSDPSLGPETLADAIARTRAEVLIVRSTKVPGAVLASAPTLRLIVRAGAGYDNIDAKAAAERGIAVCNCPGMNAAAVAELTIGHLICCDRRLPDQKIEMQAGRWRKKEFGKAKGLKGMTLGVLGTGAIGREVIRRARAFDMSLVAWSRSLTRDKAAELGVEFGGNTRADLLAMLPRCDAVTVHVAASDETKRMCNADFFAAMKPGSYFVNTSRGSVVDDAALLHAIRTKGIRAGLDVYSDQPADPESDYACAYASLPGVSVSHHCGASTDQAQEAVAQETVRIVRTFKETGNIINRVN